MSNKSGKVSNESAPRQEDSDIVKICKAVVANPQAARKLKAVQKDSSGTEILTVDLS